MDPDFWDAEHWELAIEDIEFEIANWDKYWSILPMEELEVNLQFFLFFMFYVFLFCFFKVFLFPLCIFILFVKINRNFAQIITYVQSL